MAGSRVTRVPILAVALAVVACGQGSASPPASAPASPPGTPGASAPALTPVVTRAPAAPPVVALAAPGGGPVAGDLGSYSWDGFVSDAPWVLGAARLEVSSGGILEATVAGGPEPGPWTATFARVTAGEVADVVEAAGAGPGLPIRVAAPGAGDWSLRVEVHHADLGKAAWYWRVTVAP